MNEDIKKRKELRLKQYDYSSAGAYFVTICIKDRKQILSNIVKPVGVGALDDPKIALTNIGEIVEKNLISNSNISGVTIDAYVIMPDHIHFIIILDSEKYKIYNKGSSRAPTPTNAMLPHIVSTFKRFCVRDMGFNPFQRGYMEHIIRSEGDYEKRIRYIYENPIRWYYKKMNDE